MGKKVFLTESQIEYIREASNIGNRFAYNPRKVLIIKNFLDAYFIKLSMDSIDNRGLYAPQIIYGMRNNNGESIKNLSGIQLDYLLLNRFPHLMGNQEQNNAFVRAVRKYWALGKIGNDGMLPTNYIETAG